MAAQWRFRLDAANSGDKVGLAKSSWKCVIFFRSASCPMKYLLRQYLPNGITKNFFGKMLFLAIHADFLGAGLGIAIIVAVTHFGHG